MVHLYMGDYKTIKNKYCSGYKYVSNITDYLLKHRFGLFNKQKDRIQEEKVQVEELQKEEIKEKCSFDEKILKNCENIEKALAFF